MSSSDDIEQVQSDARYFTTKFHITFSMASDAMLIIYRHNLTIEAANRAAGRLFGYTTVELEGMSYTDLCADVSGCSELLNQQYSYHSGIVHRRKNKKTFLAAISYGYFRHEQDRLVLISLKDRSLNKDCMERVHKQEKMIHDDKLLSDTEMREAYLQGEESERLRLSKELHDHIGQLLISSKISVERCLMMSDNGKMNDLLECSLSQLISLIDEVRDISHSVVSGFVKPQSLPESIQGLADRFSSILEIVLDMNTKELPAYIASFAHINIYRILEETLSNISKHAGASRVVLTLNITDFLLIIEIVDNGKGLQTHPPENTYGMSVMQHRVRLLGGEIKFMSAFGKFFKTLLFVPLKKWTSENNSLFLDT